MINPLVAIIIASVVLITQSFAEEAPDLRDARQRYEAGPQTESARSLYLTELVRMRERIARNKDETWKAVDAEIMRHQEAPDSAVLSKRMIGKWRSPRHDYIYRGDGTWSMLPVEPDTTGGTWRIEGNQHVETNVLGTFRYTILLLTAKDFVETDGQIVFYRKRLSK